MREEARAAGTLTGKEPFNFFLSVLFPDNQLTILPYNRVVADRAGMSADELLDRVRTAGFEVEPAQGAVVPERAGVVGMFTDGRWWRLSFGEALAAEIAAADPVASLDVSVLQERVLSPVLGIGDVRVDPRISFVGGIRGVEELERRAGTEGVAFSMFATSIDQLLAVPTPACSCRPSPPGSSPSCAAASSSTASPIAPAGLSGDGGATRHFVLSGDGGRRGHFGPFWDRPHERNTMPRDI